MMTPLASIIVPAFNEASRLEESLPILLDYAKRSEGAELIVVDDGSTDETSTVVARLANRGAVRVRCIRYEQNRGKGHAVRVGLLAARAPIAVFTDADLSTPISELPKLLTPIVSGKSDLTFGSRALDRALIGVHQPRLREIGGQVFNLLMRAGTGLPFQDTQCGFKAFRMSVCRPIVEAATVDRFGFDVELLYVAHRAGLRLQEIPVRWDHRDGSKVSVRRDSLRMIEEIRLIRRQAAAGVYDRAINDVWATTPRTDREWALRPLVPKVVG